MAQTPLEDFRAWAEALGLGGVLLEVVRRLMARRKVKRILREAAAGVVQDPAAQVDLQRALNAAMKTLLAAHDRDFSALRGQMAAQAGELAACRASHDICEAKAAALEARVAVLERAVPPVKLGQPS